MIWPHSAAASFGLDEHVERRGHAAAARSHLAADRDVEARDLLAVDVPTAGVSARSCDSACVQCSMQPVMPTLNFRGRFVNALLPRNASVNSRTIGEASNSSCGVSPAAGQPMTLRMLSMPVCSDTSPTASSRSPDLRHVLDREAAELDLLARGDVDEAGAELLADVGDARGSARRW